MTKSQKKKPTRKPKYFYLGERRIVHLRLPKAIKDGMHLRALQADIKKQEVWDEACKWFLEHPLPKGSRAYEHPLSREPYATMWIAGLLVEQLQKVATRDDVSLARVIHTAATHYLSQTKK